MNQTNMTEMFRERQLGLLREAEDRRLARRLRKVGLREHSRAERQMAGFRRVFASWGRTSVPFFRA